LSFERHAQKSRTRETLLAAARSLLAEKATLTIPAVAEAAGISRATAYRYFSDPSVLAAEAGLDVSTLPYDDLVQDCSDTRERVLAIALFFFDQALEHETEFRNFLSRWLDNWRLDGGAPTRGGRRVTMFRSALQDERNRIGDEACERLVRELSAATGAEAMIALLDVAEADPATARATIAHMVEILVTGTLGKPEVA
jgi:AcrR family transcriptional regulator